MTLTTDIVSSFVSGNKMGVADLPALIGQIHAALSTVATGKSEPEPQNLEPAVPIKAMLLGKSHVGEHIVLGRVHDGGELGDLRPDLIGDGAPLQARSLGCLLSEGGGDEGRETTRRPLLPACANTFLMTRFPCLHWSWPRQRD